MGSQWTCLGGGCQDQQVGLIRGGGNIAGERCQGSNLRQDKSKDKKECLKGRIF